MLIFIKTKKLEVSHLSIPAISCLCCNLSGCQWKCSLLCLFSIVSRISIIFSHYLSDPHLTLTRTGPLVVYFALCLSDCARHLFPIVWFFDHRVLYIWNVCSHFFTFILRIWICGIMPSLQTRRHASKKWSASYFQLCFWYWSLHTGFTICIAVKRRVVVIIGSLLFKW